MITSRCGAWDDHSDTAPACQISEEKIQSKLKLHQKECQFEIKGEGITLTREKWLSKEVLWMEKNR